MPTILNPYLSFRDNAREALEFYHAVFGGELNLGTFGQMHDTGNPADAELIMHGQLTTPSGLTLMASDTPAHMEFHSGSSISVSLSGDDSAQLGGYFDKLADGGSVMAPFEKAPWGDFFGMCVDRFGTRWMVNVTASTA